MRTVPWGGSAPVAPAVVPASTAPVISSRGRAGIRRITTASPPLAAPPAPARWAWAGRALAPRSACEQGQCRYA